MLDVASLKTAFSTNTSYAELATIAVFIGLLGDIIVILAFDLFDPEKSWWEIGLAGTASLIIAAGVWSEWHFGHLATHASTQLQQYSEGQIAELNREANQFAKDAELARRDIAKANERAALASKRAAQAR